MGPTLFGPRSIVVHRLPFFHDFDGGIAGHVKPASQPAGRCSIHFGHRDGRVILLQGLCYFLILGCKLLAVATPSKGQMVQIRGYMLGIRWDIAGTTTKRQTRGATNIPWCIKFHQNCVLAFHESIVVAISENQHPVLFFHLCVVFIFIFVITVLSGLLILCII